MGVVAAGLLAVGAATVPAGVAQAAGDVRGIVASTSSGSVVSLGSGTYRYSNFDGNGIGVDARGKAGLRGAGVGSTVVRMSDYTSSKRGSVPTASGTTNPLYLMMVNGSPTVSDVTLQGSPQGHNYNGLKVQTATNARVSNVKVAAVPGSGYVPPAETFAINDQRSSGSVYSGVEVDGAGVTATAFAANSSSNLTIRSSYFHNSPGSAGVALWQTNNAVLTDVRSNSNRTGLNFERSTGTITVTRPTLLNNSNQDIFMGSDQSNATLKIYDPVYSGSKLRIRVGAVYHGVANRQLRSSIHVYVGGVDRTSSVVQWI